jgi:imidazolonepropionase-like amidohydrolase
VTPGVTVVVEGSRIAAVGPDGEVSIPAGARVVEAEGKTLLPGLFDMHVHLSPIDGILHMAAGVTTVRDMANDIDQLLDMRQRFDDGTAIGPRVIMAGFMDGPGPYAGPTKVLVDTEAEIREWIARYDSLGYEQIKIYSSIQTELVPAITDAAREHGMKVSGHIPAFMTAEQAVMQGFGEITHANMLFLNFQGDTLDTRTPARFTAVAQYGAELDLESDSVQDFLQLLKDREVIVDPTVSIWEGMFTGRPGEVSPNFEPVADRLPPTVRRGFLAGGLPVPDEMDMRYRESFQRILDMVAEVYEQGITIVPGTDAMAGFALHRELELYERAGIPAAQVLRIATLGSAEVAGRADQLGSIEPGKLADMILVDGDPTARMSDIRNVRLVMKDGVLFDAASLYRAIGVAP